MSTPIKRPPKLDGYNKLVGRILVKDTVYFSIIFIPILPLSRYDCERKGNTITFYGKLELHLWQKLWLWTFIGILSFFIVKFFTSISKSSSPKKEWVPVMVSQYQGNQLDDGASPFDDCFGKGLYRGQASLTIKNGGNTDAIVLLYSEHLDRTIRNEYVRKNSTFKMTKIEQGNYRIKVFHGNDWNPEKLNHCDKYGSFDSDVHFSEFSKKVFLESNYDGYTEAEITLYTVSGGNARTTNINADDFFGD